MENQEAIAALRSSSQVYVAYCRLTNMPYVEEGAEDASDRVFLFSTKEEIFAFGKMKQEEQMPILGMLHENQSYQRLFTILLYCGADTVVYTHDGKEDILPLGQIASLPDFSKLEPPKRPLVNPSLQLCGLYFLQALRHPKRKEAASLIRSLEEELIANLRRSTFLVVVQLDEEDPKRLKVTYVKRKDGTVFIPCFSDSVELQKFSRGQSLRAMGVPFGKLLPLLIDEAKGFVINPMGFNLPLDRETMKKLSGGA